MSTQDNAKLVTDFCMALEGKLADAVGALAEDVDYVNIPMEPVKGREASRQFLEPFLGEGRHCLRKMAILHTTATGNIVMNERLETWEKGDVHVDLPVFGVFEIENGKIAKWRDYFDLRTGAAFFEAVAKG